MTRSEWKTFLRELRREARERRPKRGIARPVLRRIEHAGIDWSIARIEDDRRHAITSIRPSLIAEGSPRRHLASLMAEAELLRRDRLRAPWREPLLRRALRATLAELARTRRGLASLPC